MCIRDRNNPSWANIVTNTIDAGIYIFKPEVLKYIQMEEKWDINTQLLPYLLEKGIDIRAVSYTHLDVYKRQDKESISIFCSFTFI